MNLTPEQEAKHKLFLIKSKMETLKCKLAETDFQAIKYAEGVISAEDYAPIKKQREDWRKEYNELEAKLK